MLSSKQAHSFFYAFFLALKEIQEFKNSLINGLYNRIHSIHFSKLDQFLINQQKKYEKRIIKYEDFVDDVYAYEQYQFKQFIQMNLNLSNLLQDYLTFKYYLVSCIEAQSFI